MRQISSTEFRAKQSTWFDMADQGEQVVISRKGKRSYLLTPIFEIDLDMTPKLEQQIEQARRELVNGETICCKNQKELHELLDSL